MKAKTPLSPDELFRQGLSVRLRYRCIAEREQIRQGVYRAARKAGIRLHVTSEGEGYGFLRVTRAIEGKCLDSLPEPTPVRDYHYDPAKDEAGDLAAVAEMRRTMRTVVAEMRGGTK